jgi:hypothetical protein
MIRTRSAADTELRGKWQAGQAIEHLSLNNSILEENDTEFQSSRRKKEIKAEAGDFNFLDGTAQPRQPSHPRESLPRTKRVGSFTHLASASLESNADEVLPARGAQGKAGQFWEAWCVVVRSVLTKQCCPVRRKPAGVEGGGKVPDEARRGAAVPARGRTGAPQD